MNTQKQYVVISCPIDTYSGYGARARDFVKATIEAKKDSWDVWVMPQRWGNTPWNYIEDHKEEWGWLTPKILPFQQPLTKKPDVWMQITIPNEFQPVGSYNIGVTAGIETTIVDAGWLLGCNRMDLTLISSEHSKNILLNTVAEKKDQHGRVHETIRVTKPVEVIFEGVDINSYFPMKDEELEETDLVKHIDEIPESFAYLFVGHWLSGELGEDRKNVGMTIKVFLETFKNKKNPPCLILKTSTAGGSIMDRTSVLSKINSIRKTVKGTLPNIYLIHGELEEKDINYLYNHPKVKAMINLTKGEGFGRPILEFSFCKKPIICSGWSGQLDFLNPEFVTLLNGTITKVHPSAVVENIILAESSWFTPDYVQAGQALLDIHMNYKKYLDKANRQAFFSKSNFSFEKMTEKLKEYYDNYVKEQPKLVLPQLPKLKKI